MGGLTSFQIQGVSHRSLLHLIDMQRDETKQQLFTPWEGDVITTLALQSDGFTKVVTIDPE